MGDAIATLETASALQSLPETSEALRRGELSAPQVKIIAAAAVDNPRAESELLRPPPRHSSQGPEGTVRAGAGRGDLGRGGEGARTRPSARRQVRAPLGRSRRGLPPRRQAHPRCRGQAAVRARGRRPMPGSPRPARPGAREPRPPTWPTPWWHSWRGSRRSGVERHRCLGAPPALCDSPRRPAVRGRRCASGWTPSAAAGLRQSGRDLCTSPGWARSRWRPCTGQLSDAFVKILVTDGTDVTTVCHVGRAVPPTCRARSKSATRRAWSRGATSPTGSRTITGTCPTPSAGRAPGRFGPGLRRGTTACSPTKDGCSPAVPGAWEWREPPGGAAFETGPPGPGTGFRDTG